MPRRPRLALISLASLCTLALLGGCYQHVVSAKGMGASRHRVQESERSNTAADRAFDSLFGTPQPASRWEQPPSSPSRPLPAPRPVTAGKQAPKN